MFRGAERLRVNGRSEAVCEQLRRRLRQDNKPMGHIPGELADGRVKVCHSEGAGAKRQTGNQFR